MPNPWVTMDEARDVSDGAVDHLADHNQLHALVNDIAPAGGGGLVYLKSADWTIGATEGGVYVVDTTSGNITATLPAVSAVATTGMRLVFKRLGANYLYVTCAGSDHFDLDGTTTKTLWSDDNALSIAALPGVALTWMEFGYFGAVT